MEIVEPSDGPRRRDAAAPRRTHGLASSSALDRLPRRRRRSSPPTGCALAGRGSTSRRARRMPPSSASTATPGPPALLGEWLDARGIAVRRQRLAHRRPAADVRDVRARVASLGCRTSPDDADVPAGRGRARLLSARRRRTTSRCSASASAARCSPTCSAAPSSARRRPSSAGTRSRPTTRTRSPPARGCSGTTTASRTPPGATELARTEDAAAGVPPRPPPRRPVPPRVHDRDRRGLGAQGRRALKTAGGIDDGAALLDAPAARHASGRAQAAFRLFDAFRAGRERMIEESRAR